MLRISSVLVAVLAAVLLVGATGAPALAAATPEASHHATRSALYPKHSHPFGSDMATWGERISRWIYRQPLAHNPLLDQTGADCGIDQHGPVWFIPPIAGPHIEDSARTCTIPRHKAIFLDIGSDLQEFPCPDPAFRPDPGESLFHFLIRQDKPIMDSVNELDVSLDGHPLDDVLSYRFVSDDLFTITGDLSLQQRLDPCITGLPQPAIVDGFFMMFKPLRPGTHTIVVHGTNTFGDDKRFTYRLTVG
ncbi:MAG: hypothetical protein DLM57_08995 [Pseudonocardiales bacterium]|nr:MAG: hypothetical protein DLM57_08995 [Pseudonocardiales bacterium]